MDATFALALVPALAVLFFVVMPALDRQDSAPRRPRPVPKTRTAAPYRSYDEAFASNSGWQNLSDG